MWHNLLDLRSHGYRCGYCNRDVASEKGYIRELRDVMGGVMPADRWIYICHLCQNPTYFTGGVQYPGVPFGGPIEGISDPLVSELYEEARKTFSANAYTATAMACRKILMNIAVVKKAKEGLNFIDYVDYLCDNHFLPPGSKDWVDQIRDMGNDANHKIEIIQKEAAERIMFFTSALLTFIYTLPAQSKKTQGNKP